MVSEEDFNEKEVNMVVETEALSTLRNHAEKKICEYLFTTQLSFHVFLVPQL